MRRTAAAGLRSVAANVRRTRLRRRNGPLPPSALIQRVTGAVDENWFTVSGRKSVDDLEQMLALIDTRLADYQRILDFGCGPGRILLALRRVARHAELVGVDIDAEAVAWAQENIPFARIIRTEPLPPLPLDDGSVDLVFSHSVFTHIDEGYQDAWLAELHRVTRPGGALVASVNGPHSYEHHVPLMQPVQQKASELGFYDRGFVFLADDWWSGGPYPDWYHTAFHQPWYVFRHWGRIFDVAAYVKRGSLDFQDFVVMRRL